MADTEGPKFCHFCDHNFPRPGEFACDDCLPKLKALMVATTVLDSGEAHRDFSPSIQFKNVKLSSDYPGEAIIAIDGTGAQGVQKPFKFDGQGKCIVCAELTTNALVCFECTEGIQLARNLRTRTLAREWIDVMNDEGLVALMKFVSSNAVKKYMEAEIEQFGES